MGLRFKRRAICLGIGIFVPMTLFAQGNHFDCGESFSVLAERMLAGAGESFEKPKRIEVGGKVYQLKRVIGESTARVYLAADEQFIVKLYSPENETLVQYEYWATKFLKEKGAPVVNVVGPPEQVVFQNQRQIAIVKKYVKGIPGNRVHEAVGDDFYLLFDEYVAKRHEIGKYFANNQFVNWLKAKGIKIETVERWPGDQILHKGDLAIDNFVYTGKEWILIDP